MRTRGVRLPADVEHVIRSLHPDLKRRVRAAVDLLCANPEAGKALKGELTGWRSLRVGRLRVVYRESRRQIEVAAIGPPVSIYFETTRRLRRGSTDCAEDSRGCLCAPGAGDAGVYEPTGGAPQGG